MNGAKSPFFHLELTRRLAVHVLNVPEDVKYRHNPDPDQGRGQARDAEAHHRRQQLVGQRRPVRVSSVH